MASVSETLQLAKDDLTELKGKEVELSRQQKRLSNQREVFREQLERIENELSSVEDQLQEITGERRTVTRRIIWLRLKVFFQVVAQCLLSVYTLLSFLLVNLLNLLYVTLTVSANLTRTLLETQARTSLAYSDEYENYRKSSSCFT